MAKGRYNSQQPGLIWKSIAGRERSRDDVALSDGQVREGLPHLPGHPLPSRGHLHFLRWGNFVDAQPTQDLDPADTEAIISTFLNNATEQGCNDATVNDMLEEILRQDEAHQRKQTRKSEKRGRKRMRRRTTLPYNLRKKYKTAFVERRPLRRGPPRLCRPTRGRRRLGSVLWTSTVVGHSGISMRQQSMPMPAIGWRKQRKRRETAYRAGEKSTPVNHITMGCTLLREQANNHVTRIKIPASNISGAGRRE